MKNMLVRLLGNELPKAPHFGIICDRVTTVFNAERWYVSCWNWQIYLHRNFNSRTTTIICSGIGGIVDALDLESNDFDHIGSNPISPTNFHFEIIKP